jgi:cytochrome c-type biogenesis protein CcmE
VTRKQRRLAFVLAGMVTLGAATGLVLYNLKGSLVFFYSPTDLVTKQVPKDRRIRIGGLVAAGSVKRDGNATVEFRVTDTAHSVPVTYHGVLPDLFREGQGVVAEGRFDPGGEFRADEVLAKHDEKYMPPEVVTALKKAGEWRPAGAQAERPAAAQPAAPKNMPVVPKKEAGR